MIERGFRYVGRTSCLKVAIRVYERFIGTFNLQHLAPNIVITSAVFRRVRDPKNTEIFLRDDQEAGDEATKLLNSLIAEQDEQDERDSNDLSNEEYDDFDDDGNEAQKIRKKAAAAEKKPKKEVSQIDRMLKLRGYYTLAFDYKMEADDDTCYFAFHFPYTKLWWDVWVFL